MLTLEKIDGASFFVTKIYLWSETIWFVFLVMYEMLW